MKPALKVATVLSGLVGSAMMAAATTSPSDFDTNIAAWLSVMGWEDPPKALVSSNADLILAAIGAAFVVAAILGAYGWWASGRAKRPSTMQGPGSTFIRGNVKNLELENNYSSADTFVNADVESLAAKRNLHDPGGHRPTIWQGAKEWLTKDRD